jgi:peptide-methionine (S)-S-oxide reductase
MKSRHAGLAIAGACAILAFAQDAAVAARAAANEVVVPVTLLGSSAKAPPVQTVVLAGGCFWGVEGVFEHVRGVLKVVSGYAGGAAKDADYDVVSTGRTGHAESVQVTFDPGQVSYGEILRIFFSVAHDPTQLNRQGPDTGTQYRSAIFYADKAQKDLATGYIRQLEASGKYAGRIVTRVDPLEGFYPAEGYHQDFIENNPRNPYVMVNDLPKLRELKALYPNLYRASTTSGRAAE